MLLQRLIGSPALNLLRSIYLQEKCLCQRFKTGKRLLSTKGQDSSNITEEDKFDLLGDDTGLMVEKTSKAMKAYLARAQKYNAFMAEKREEFATGKRHLANMMGVDHNTLTQKDIDEAIEYLFPSGLFVPAARPLMRPPEEVFPPKKDAEFDDFGRPFHTLFYTGKPNYYQLLHYANLIELLDRVAQHPYSYTIKDEILKYRIPFMSTSLSSFANSGVVQHDDQGREFVRFDNDVLRRKTARGSVTVYKNGTGKIKINGQDLLYFERMQSREQILFPLQFTGLLNKVDIEATVHGGGTSTQAGVIRLGISLALRHFVDENMTEKMRIAGLLTRDVRRKERKKFGQMKARRKYTWKKR
ncbi:28S ribosomal protein S9, mitochondrial isoform X2 [Nilaparvata lugens]|uniref:28S ribosomal protein S9, mitochondrial isoform X2 n=1 Tax=Nilaparvata lugens TaxID=108931 RepID=UPI00193E164D|nr:28S ribosomal protein S9, mitochondrial isoform X2 [Nilaparvata lugens]